VLFLKRVSIVLLLAAVLVIGAFFSVQNASSVPLDLLVFQLADRPLALWILLAFALGGVLGVAISAVTIVRLKSGQISLRRQLDKQARQSGHSAPALAKD